MARTPDLSGSALDGRYELHALIGEGAFGRVYRGRDRRLARPVAVKVIKPWWAEDSAWVERFQREAQLLARISDPGIVQIYDIGHDEHGPYYVAELVDGESLAERLRSGPLKPAEARAIAEQLCDALAGAHAQGIVHCDVKPANVLIAADAGTTTADGTGGGKVKVGDFGVARLAEGTSQAPSATVAGTPRYMSPEQARGRPTGPATDVYSAGVVLYEMLAGEPPFAHGSAVELGLRHVQEQPPRLAPEIPAPLREVVGRALAKEPADRYRDGGEMAGALRAMDLLEDLEEPSRTVTRTIAARQPESRQEPSSSDRSAAPTVIDRAAASTVIASSSPTKIMIGGGGSRGSKPPRDRRGTGKRAPRRRQIALVAALLALAGGALAVVLIGQTAAAHTSVPELRGLPRAGVQARARRMHMQTVFSTSHSPTAAGIAIAQNPSSGTRVTDGATVHVVLSSGPQWRALTTFSGVDDGRSVPFRILGSKWRVNYSMSYEGSCTLLVVCFGPSAEVDNLKTGASFDGFELGEGETESHTFDSGPGLYRMVISGGHDSARWSMTVEDYD
jgi:serine/threonine protein kinase